MVDMLVMLARDEVEEVRARPPLLDDDSEQEVVVAAAAVMDATPGKTRANDLGADGEPTKLSAITVLILSRSDRFMSALLITPMVPFDDESLDAHDDVDRAEGSECRGLVLLPTAVTVEGSSFPLVVEVVEVVVPEMVPVVDLSVSSKILLGLTTAVDEGVAVVVMGGAGGGRSKPTSIDDLFLPPD